MADERSVNIKGNVAGAVINAGDKNRIEARIKAELSATPLPPAASVDILQELASIRSILEHVAQGNRAKINRALDDAHEEAGKSVGNKEEVGEALERALKFAKGSTALVGEVDALLPHLKSAVSWLGDDWTRLLSLVGVRT